MIPRYSLPEMTAVWSDQTKLELWLRIEVLACEAWAQLGRIPPEDLERIQQRAGFSIDRVLEIEQTTQHDVAAFVQNVAENVGEAGRWIHFGMTSSDLLDTGLALQLREAADILLQRVERLLAVSARGTDLGAARERAYAAVSHLSFRGMQYRWDIAARVAGID